MIALALVFGVSICAGGQKERTPTAATTAAAATVAAATVAAAKITPAITHGEGVEVTIASGEGVTLAGTFVVPSHDGQGAPTKLAAVVFITGSGLQDRDETVFGHKPFRVLAAALAEHGIASVRCDDRGFGASTGNPSFATTLDFLSDAKAQVAWLRARPEIDPMRVGIVGHSEGGLIGTLMAQGPDAAMNFAVLLAPPGITGAEVLVRQSADMYVKMGAVPGDAAYAIECHREMLDAVMSGSDDATLTPIMKKLVEAQCAVVMKTKPSAALVESAVQQGMQQVNSPWMRTFLPLDPAPAIAKISVPTLVLFGERDVQVSPQHSLKPFENGADKSPVKPEIVVIAKANHLFQSAVTGMPDEYATIKETMDPAVPILVAQWIVRTTSAMPTAPAVSPKSSP
ncbi:MAG: alpha/beta fold hydrolase [Phycisphaerales bacterium]|nr:alpha/beta fold hydrolase [Phycisphaerales bacterium]